MSKQNPITAFDFQRLNCNNLGHPRYVIDHRCLLTDAELEQRRNDLANGAGIERYNATLDRYYVIACKRANRIGGKKYSTKAYASGIAFISFHLDETIEYIEAALMQSQASPSPAPKRKRSAKAAILKGD